MDRRSSFPKCEVVRLALAIVNKTKDEMLEKSVRIDMMKFRIEKKQREILMARQVSENLRRVAGTSSSSISHNESKIRCLDLDVARLKMDLLQAENDMRNCEEAYGESLKELRYILRERENVRLALATVNQSKDQMLEKSVRIDMMKFRIEKKEGELLLAREVSINLRKVAGTSSPSLSHNESKISCLDLAVAQLRSDLIAAQKDLMKCEETYNGSLEELKYFLRERGSRECDEFGIISMVPLEIEVSKK